MIQRNEQLVIVRGGGDIATGTISRLFHSGYLVVILEIAAPSAIRRQVALSEAVYDCHTCQFPSSSTRMVSALRMVVAL